MATKVRAIYSRGDEDECDEEMAGPSDQAPQSTKTYFFAGAIIWRLRGRVQVTVE
jgi:hypothetical protein